MTDLDFLRDASPDGALELLKDLGSIESGPRRKLILDEAYYEHFGLKTPAETKHPFTGVLALESERYFEHSGYKSRIDAFIDLDIGSLGFADFQSFIALPREMVEYVIKKAAKIKSDKARRTSVELENLSSLSQGG